MSHVLKKLWQKTVLFMLFARPVGRMLPRRASATLIPTLCRINKFNILITHEVQLRF